MSKNLYIEKIGEKAKLASLHLSNINIEKRNSVLKQYSQYLRINSKSILNSNKKDVSNGNIEANEHFIHSVGSIFK